MSCTADVRSFPCIVDGARVNLIDSPGFDDSRMSDAEVLAKLVHYLTQGPPIHGVIFLHRITDTRLSGSAIKTAQVIKRVCGRSFLNRVALVTSMWDVANDKTAAYRRESEMLAHPLFWAPFHRDGASYLRFSRSALSARKVVESSLARQRKSLVREDPPPLQIVEQSSAGKSLAQTDAGAYLLGELSKQRQSSADAAKALEREALAAERRDDGKMLCLLREEHTREMARVRGYDLAQRRMGPAGMRHL